MASTRRRAAPRPTPIIVEGNRTRCPNCGTVVIDRVGFAIRGVNLKGSNCGKCGERIDLAGVDS